MAVIPSKGEKERERKGRREGGREGKEGKERGKESITNISDDGKYALTSYSQLNLASRMRQQAGTGMVKRDDLFMI